MNTPTTSHLAELGMVGLGVMGRNLLLNIADHGFPVAGYDKDAAKVTALTTAAGDKQVHSTADIRQFIDSLRRPRAIMMLVPAGAPVDSVIRDLLPHLEQGDLIIDGGNSHFTDTDTRARTLTARGIHFLGVGVSGGEEGARHGPSIMPGGPKAAYERVRPILEAAAAKVEGSPCVTYLGPGSAGHFVKMVHNGIEYGIMQLIAESYDFMKRGLGLTDDELHAEFSEWNRAELNAYLIEITAHIFQQPDQLTGERLIDVILDVARQKGTGMWTSQAAMDLQVPVPTIDAAVAMRNLSAYAPQREQIGSNFPRAVPHLTGDPQLLLGQLRSALYAGMILTYTQGMALLAVASVEHDYQLDLAAVARIWRGGCIIRAALLDPIDTAFTTRPDLSSLLLDPTIGAALRTHQESLRHIVGTACALGIPAPALMASLGYLDAFRSTWLPANLIQAQRDYFGAHTYERTDAKGTFHTAWEQPA